MAKDKYEISLWDDVFVAASGSVPGHYEEEKIAVIGSDTMTAQCRAIEPKLVCNINGKITFTFKMFLRYHDELTGEDYDNPFLKLLINERKIKVQWLGQWYDLIIKNIQEASNGKSVTYTCEDANINELAKSGFDLIFDDELSINTTTGGNQGTVQQLVERTIEGTDWQIGENEVIQQFNEEPVYEVTVTQQIPIWNMNSSTRVYVPQGQKILVFYPQLAEYINKSSTEPSANFNPFYIAYDPEQKYERYAKTEMLIQAECYQFGSSGISDCECVISNNILTFGNSHLPGTKTFGSVNINDISSRYRANRLISQPVTQIEPVSGKNCYVYVATEDGTGTYSGKVSEGDIIYENVGSEFGDALYATNLIANGRSFINLSGWESLDAHPLTLEMYPDNQEGIENSTVYLTIPSSMGLASNLYIYNDALRANSQYFKDGCKQGEVFRLRVKGLSGNTHEALTSSNIFSPIVVQYTRENTDSIRQPAANATSYFDVTSAREDPSDANWVYFDLTCKESFTGSDIYRDNIGLFLVQRVNYVQKYIEEIQFFKVTKDSEGNVILPTELDKTGIINTTYTYFSIKNGEINYLYKGTTDWNKTGVQLEQQYNTGYSKIRSINIKQSNRFNILQTIAETFECWIRFYVPHESNGSLQYVNGVPQKFITIKQEMGTERGFGFVYGIDLQSIQRTIESNQIVTKTIVLENNNEAGKNGTCRISRSLQNYPKTDYIFNFDYYINHGLLDASELYKDLYGTTGDFRSTRAFYSNLRKWNTEYEEAAEQNSNYEIALNKNEGYKIAYETARDAAAAEIEIHKAQVTAMAGTEDYTSNVTKKYIVDHIKGDKKDLTLIGHMEAIQSQQALVTHYGQQANALNSVINDYETKISNNEAKMKARKSWIKQKTDLFQKKYARFISEGSWIDQKYYDDNLYYLDANSVAYTSSRPKVSYNIQVMRVSSIEGFELRKFNLGDITSIEDTEFFGYVYINEVKTPYREKVVLTEVTYNFDEPNKDSFKVQNYRTQFEDLFQRIAAQTQSLQYSVGAYAKVSDIINSDSTIKGSLLKRSMESNESALDRSSLNNSVVTNEQGITVTNLLNSSNAVRITSGGLFITTNGGDTWNNAIHGDGIGTEYLTSGAIDTHRIQIYGDTGTDESAIAFKWDKDGINAYDHYTKSIEQSDVYKYDPDRFARFNGEGIIIQDATGSVGDSDRQTYEKLRLGYLGYSKNDVAQYGLKINTLVNGAVRTAFEATESSLTVTGGIKATSLTLEDGAIFDVDAAKMSIDGESILNWTKDQFTSQISSLSIGTRNYLREINNVVRTAIPNLCSDFNYDSKAGVYRLTAAARGTNTGYCELRASLDGLYSIESLQGKKCRFHANSITVTNTALHPRVYLIFLDSTKQQQVSREWLERGALSKEVTVPSTAVYVQLVIQMDIDKAEVAGDILRVRGLMLEVSDIDSDWVPAHEDIEEVTTTRINQTNEQIALQAEKVLPLKNLLQNSGSFEDWGYSKPASSSDPTQVAFFPSTTSGYEDCTVAGFPLGTFTTSTGNRFVCSNGTTTRIPLRKLLDKTITVSCTMRTDNQGLIGGAVVINLELRPSGGTNRTRWKTVLSLQEQLTNSYERYSATVTIPKLTEANNFFNQGSGDISASDEVILACRVSNENTTARIYFMAPQIEYGSEATEWSKAQGDNLSAQLTIQADEISLKVSSSEYTDDKVLEKVNASSLIIDPDRISLEGKQIDLTGDNITIDSTNFAVDSSGTITSKAGNIGGWTINSTSLTKKTADTGGYTIGISAPSNVTPSVNRVFYVDNDATGATDSQPFYVRYDGFLHADNAYIKGNITAKSLTLASDGSGVSIGNAPASGVTGLTINSNGLLTASNAVIYGNIYAGGGTIGGWDINSRSLSKTTSGGYTVGISAPSNPSSSAGTVNRAFYVDDNNGKTVFSVYYDGRVTATAGTIGKCTIDANGNLQVPAANISGALTAATIEASNITVVDGTLSADKINGNGLNITTNGTIGPFTITTENSVPVLKAGNVVKLTGTGIYTSNGSFSQLNGYGSATGAENIKLALSNGTTPTLYEYIRAVALQVIKDNLTSTVYKGTSVDTLYANSGTNRTLYGYILPIS